MKTSMKVSMLIIKEMAKVNILGLMDVIMTVIGLMVKNKVEVQKLLVMDVIMKVSTMVLAVSLESNWSTK